MRDELTIEVFLLKARCVDGPGLESLSTQWLDDGEDLLVRFAIHPSAGKLVQSLFAYGLAHSFDVPAKTMQAIARLEEDAAKLSDPQPLQDRIQEMRRIVDHWIEQNKKVLRESSHEHTRKLIAALLGDAQAGVELFSQRPYRDLPKYRQWLRDAKRKLAREPAGKTRSSTISDQLNHN